ASSAGWRHCGRLARAPKDKNGATEAAPQTRTEFLHSAHILYRPRSSSLNPSSQFRNCSFVLRSASAVDTFELFSTCSSTKIGQSIRNASANASLGRESMLINSPSRSTQISAKKVSSRRSLTTIFCTRTSSPKNTFFSRSWVMGRGVCTFSISSAMALASYAPTQMGRIACPCTSFSTTIGICVTGSIIRPRTFISTSIAPSLSLPIGPKLFYSSLHPVAQSLLTVLLGLLQLSLLCALCVLCVKALFSLFVFFAVNRFPHQTVRPRAGHANLHVVSQKFLRG